MAEAIYCNGGHLLEEEEEEAKNGLFHQEEWFYLGRLNGEGNRACCMRFTHFLLSCWCHPSGKVIAALDRNAGSLKNRSHILPSLHLHPAIPVSRRSHYSHQDRNGDETVDCAFYFVMTQHFYPRLPSLWTGVASFFPHGRLVDFSSSPSSILSSSISSPPSSSSPLFHENLFPFFSFHRRRRLGRLRVNACHELW